MWWRWDQPHFGKILHYWWSYDFYWLQLDQFFLSKRKILLKNTIDLPVTCRQVDRHEFTLNHIHISLITKNWYTFLLIILFFKLIPSSNKKNDYIYFNLSTYVTNWVYFAIDSMRNDFPLRPSTSKWIRVIHFQGVTSTVYQILWLWSEGFPWYLVR